MAISCFCKKTRLNLNKDNLIAAGQIIVFFGFKKKRFWISLPFRDEKGKGENGSISLLFITKKLLQKEKFAESHKKKMGA